MKAICIHSYGNQDVLKYEDVPIPTILEDEILVRVIASAINPVDWKIREGYLKDMIPHKMPLILGWDIAGIVDKVGSKVTNFAVGDCIYSRPDISKNGGYAEYIAIKASEVGFKPKNISFVEAASFPLAGLTAWQGLIDIANIQKGHRVLIHAGAGGVGSLAIQLAKWKGAHVITTTSSANTDFVKSLGADEVIDYTKHNFSDLVSNIDIVLDSMGGEIQESSMRVMKPGGTLVALTGIPSEEMAIKFGITAKFALVEPNAFALEQLANLLDSGIIRCVVGAEFALKDVKKAHALSESSRTRGKIVLHVNQP